MADIQTPSTAGLADGEQIHFAADRAITASSQDRLGRNNFSARLAEAIYRCDAHEGLVIGLSGAWGTGKSSIKNMAIERLQGFGTNAPDVLEFNPWQFSGQDQITMAFFRELLTKVSPSSVNSDPDKTKQRAAALAKYSSYVSVASTTLKTVGLIVPALSLLAGAGDAGAKALKDASEATAVKATAETESLSDLKKHLHDEFASLERPLLIIIDDIDRLNAQEIPQIFQLVKANADLPQIIYLLLYDKLTVENALSSISSNRGKEFLEKIVQVSFDVPVVSQRRISQILTNGISEALGISVLEVQWDKIRWTNIYEECLQFYFTTLRAVKRFLASFKFQVNLLRNETETSTSNGLEVNPIDLIALECLRLFEPTILYSRLAGIKGVLTRKRGHFMYPKNIKQNEVDRLMESIVEPVATERRETVKALLEELFPPITASFSDHRRVQSQENGWFLELRVCHPRFFDRYFQFELAEDDLSEADTSRLLDALGDEEDARAELAALRDRGLLNVTLDRLNRHVKTINPEQTQSAILAVCDMSDNFPAPTREEDLFNNAHLKAWHFCYGLLRKVQSTQQRATILSSVITKSEGLSLPYELVKHEVRTEQRTSEGFNYCVADEDEEKLQRVYAERCRRSAQDGPMAFIMRADLLDQLRAWKDWGDTSTEVKEWVQQTINDPRALLAFSRRALIQGSGLEGATLTMVLQLLEPFISLEDLKSKLDSTPFATEEGDLALVKEKFYASFQERKGNEALPLACDDASEFRDEGL